jgi:hypothetical protein
MVDLINSNEENYYTIDITQIKIPCQVPYYNPGYLPVYDDYKGTDGGYVALYTRDPRIGVYSVGKEGGSTIYVMGKVRLQGYYNNNLFIPTGGDLVYRPGEDFTRDATLLNTCKKYFPYAQNDFWLGGDSNGVGDHRTSKGSGRRGYSTPTLRRFSTENQVCVCACCNRLA